MTLIGKFLVKDARFLSARSRSDENMVGVGVVGGDLPNLFLRIKRCLCTRVITVLYITMEIIMYHNYYIVMKRVSFCRRAPQQQLLPSFLLSLLPADPHRPNGWWRYHFSFLNPLPSTSSSRRVCPKTAVFRCLGGPPVSLFLPYRSIIIIL